jgi:hypothetical protein
LSTAQQLELPVGRLVNWQEAQEYSRKIRSAASSRKATSFKAYTPKRQQSPVKAASIARRRRLAACWPLPPTNAAAFTLSEQAALRVIADEMKRHGICTSCNAKIAAIAGTCVTVVKNALRKAKALRLLTVEERRRAGQRSLTNLVRFLCMAWKSWITRKGSGVRKTTTTDHGFRSNLTSEAVDSFREERSRADRAAKWSGGV